MNTSHADTTDHIVIVDFGESLPVSINGRDTFINRYGVWSERKIKIIEQGDALKGKIRS